MNTIMHNLIFDSLKKIRNPQKDIPRLAKDIAFIKEIENAIKKISTSHKLYLNDARKINFLESESVHLIVTSPPYWTLKKYKKTPGQLGLIDDYEEFINELDKVWQKCYKALVPGGRLICVVGDVCLARRNNHGEHTVIPLHSSIQEHCRRIGFSNLASIIWYKISNARYEAKRGSRFLGKPYEPNSIIKNDIEFIIMERKPGGYRKPSLESRVLSIISEENHRKWFQQIWTGLTGASTKEHPAPFPLTLAERLIRMFSFVGDTVLDPFMGVGTTNIAALRWGRNSIGIEVDSEYFQLAKVKLKKEITNLSQNIKVEIIM